MFHVLIACFNYAAVPGCLPESHSNVATSNEQHSAIQQHSLITELSKAMAMDILSIPAMSAESERVFSGARRTVSCERASLGPPRIEQNEYLKSWQINGIMKDVSDGDSEPDTPLL